MSKSEDKFVLAIFPNARGLGFAFMQNAMTVKDYQMVTIRPISNATLMKQLIGHIEYYEPDVVVLEDFDGKGSRKSKRVTKLIIKIKKFADSKSITIAMYAREDIKMVFGGFGAKTKYEISRVISENIEELGKLMRPKRKIWEPEPYYQGVFDAVSLGVTHYFLSE